MQEEYLTIQDVARELKVSEQTIRRLVKSGELPSIQVKGRYRVTRSDLTDYLKKSRRQKK